MINHYQYKKIYHVKYKKIENTYLLHIYLKNIIMAITACTDATEYKLYSGNTATIHPEINDIVYDDSLSGYTSVPSIQCRSVRIGGSGINC